MGKLGDILDAIAALDADVAYLEAARSRMELVRDLLGTGYPQEIGPGVYDIHSPEVPTVTEMRELIEAGLRVLEPTQAWVNPDCGLKTRTYAEIVPALRNMVAATAEVRSRLT